jgi:hypothetical protein
MMWAILFRHYGRGARVTRSLVRNIWLAAAGLVIVLVAGAAANAAGYWNLPGNLCQWCGCGFSGGYHAPFVLGPHTHDCLTKWNETRLPCAPNPYACAPYCGNGMASGFAPNPQMNEPAMSQPPAVMPTEQVEPEARRRVLFQAPVQL